MTLYILDEMKNLTPADPIAWDEARRRACEDGSWTVARDEVFGAIVSTVFVGIPTSPDLPACVFETAVRLQTEDCSEVRSRYDSWAAAEEGHRQTVKSIRSSLYGKNGRTP